MTKEEWIILRLLKGWVGQTPARAMLHPDCVRTIQYMCNKYGKDKVFDAIDRLPLSR
jgi:hypothetical protein